MDLDQVCFHEISLRHEVLVAGQALDNEVPERAHLERRQMAAGKTTLTVPATPRSAMDRILGALDIRWNAYGSGEAPKFALDAPLV